MSQETQIYVYLLDEGTDVWRPVYAEDMGNQVFRIVSSNADPEDEHWQFSTGDVVRCEYRLLADAAPHKCLVAVEKVGDSQEPASLSAPQH